ncbi:MAG TPA: carboxypeptidase-like regulatory domain-containing protein [Glaciihabitans sp.]|nr:carboxypeptidase-like regulatory domain-containing protein [Glaciihabitans sp.]
MVQRPRKRDSGRGVWAGSEESGFSLVEVVVAVFIFAVLCTGALYTVVSVLQVSRDSRARHVAANLAAQEIDLARDATDLRLLTDIDRAEVRVGSDSYQVSRRAQWVSSSGADDPCGAGDGTLQYKRVNIEVRWSGMGDGTAPVRADTLIAPQSRAADADHGTILVSVRAASGAGSSGVTVTAQPASTPAGATSTVSAVTDAQGCAFLDRVVPGNYVVTAARAGFLDSAGSASPTQTTRVGAATSTSVAFEYDRAATFTVAYAPGVAGAVYLPGNLHTTFVAASGQPTVISPTATTGTTSRTRLQQMFPATSGYVVLAGRYTAPTSGGSAGCLSVDPAAWPTVGQGPGALVGIRPAPAAASPGGGVTANVPMGVLTLSALPAGGRLTATSATPPQGSGDPGCAQITSYSFGELTAPATIALPYGTWNLTSTAGTISPGSLTLLSGGVITPTPSATITLDPRAVTP